MTPQGHRSTWLSSTPLRVAPLAHKHATWTPASAHRREECSGAGSSAQWRGPILYNDCSAASPPSMRADGWSAAWRADVDTHSRHKYKVVFLPSLCSTSSSPPADSCHHPRRASLIQVLLHHGSIRYAGSNAGIVFKVRQLRTLGPQCL